MASQQLKSRLAQATAILADCERFLEDPREAWDAVELKNRVGDFMDIHRDEQHEGGQP
jgi:hypothetical protein